MIRLEQLLHWLSWNWRDHHCTAVHVFMCTASPQNGMLPIILPRADVEELMKDCDMGKPLDIDLASQTISREDGGKVS
jgi:3-isopropylmalate dehydratase small subunit